MWLCKNHGIPGTLGIGLREVPGMWYEGESVSQQWRSTSLGGAEGEAMEPSGAASGRLMLRDLDEVRGKGWGGEICLPPFKTA